MDGRLILPGFYDSHCHSIEAGLQLAQCDLDNSADVDEILNRIEAYAKSNPEK